MRVTFLTFVLLIAWQASTSATLFAQSVAQDERFLEGLRQRRLFELAESHCRDRLNDSRLTPVERVQLTVELVRSFAQHSANLPPTERDPLWKLARDTVTNFQRTNADNPRRVLVQAQDALTALAKGELARQEAEIGPAAEQALPAARQTVTEAIRSLEQLDKQLTQDITQRRRTNPTLKPGELSTDDLVALQASLRLQLGRALRNLALCFPPGSDDRVASLSQASEQYDKVSGTLVEDDPLRSQIQLDQAVCQRLLGSLDKSQQLLVAVSSGSAAPETKLAARAELIRLQLDAQRPNAALQVMSQSPAGAGPSAEFEFARFETLLALWKASAEQKPAEAERWQQDAVEQVKHLEQQFGAYWGRRAELLLVAAAGRNVGIGNLEILRRTADNFFLKGEFEEAVAAYDKAAENAQTSRQPDQAFELLYKAALVRQQRQQFEDASRRLRSLSLEAASGAATGAADEKRTARIADAHLLAAWNAAQWARSEATAVTNYETLLTEHLAKWPDGASSQRARLWLGRLRESQQNWAAAVDLYQGVATTAEDFPAAVEGAMRAWPQRLQQAKRANEKLEPLVTAARTYFEQRVLGASRGDQPNKPWTMPERQAALVAAQLSLQHATNGFADAERMLSPALNGPPDPPADWKSSAQSQLVVALAGQGKRAEAERILRQIGDASPDRLLEMLVGLNGLANAARPEVRTSLAKLQLGAIDLLQPRRASMSASAQRTLDQARAESLASSGARAEALQAYEKLAREHPQSARIQEGFADLLLAADDRPTLERALDQWRRVAAKSKPGTEGWYRAKYSVALSQFKLGDKAGAASVIRYLEATNGLETTVLKRQFAELKKRCEG